MTNRSRARDPFGQVIPMQYALTSRATPNPSIERTNSELRPPFAAHVKR